MNHKKLVAIVVLGFAYTVWKNETQQIDQTPPAVETVAVKKTEQKAYQEGKIQQSDGVEFEEVQFDENGRLAQGISIADGDTTQLAIKGYCVNCFGHAVFRVEGYIDSLDIEVMQREPYEGIYYRTLAKFEVVEIPTVMDGKKSVVVGLKIIGKKLVVEAYTHIDNKKVPLQLQQSS